MTNGENSPNQTALTPVIARLKDIERKCESMGTRNEEFPLMKERLTSVISRLEAGVEASGEPLAFGAMARELFPVAHLFESMGFTSVGREISHVERTLRGLDPGAGDVPQEPTQPAPPSQSSAARPSTPGDLELDREPSDEESSSPVPWPIIVGLVLLVAAVLVAVMIILGKGPFAAKDPSTEAVPTPPVVNTPVPTPAPVATPTVRRDDTDSPKKILAESIAEARLALGRGDLEGAVRNLATASLIDRNDSSVVEIAEQLVTIFINDANHAANEQRFEDAEALLERARRISLRFGFPTAPIDRAARQHKTIVRFQILGPGETTAIRAADGKRAELRITSGVTREGHLRGIQGADLLLAVEDDMGGGVVRYVDEIPLSTIVAIKIYED